VRSAFHNIGLGRARTIWCGWGWRKQMGGLARRTFMRKSGLVDNPAGGGAAEIRVEAVTDGFLAFSCSGSEPLGTRRYEAQVTRNIIIAGLRPRTGSTWIRRNHGAGAGDGGYSRKRCEAPDTDEGGRRGSRRVMDALLIPAAFVAAGRASPDRRRVCRPCRAVCGPPCPRGWASAVRRRLRRGGVRP